MRRLLAKSALLLVLIAAVEGDRAVSHRQDCIESSMHLQCPGRETRALVAPETTGSSWRAGPTSPSASTHHVWERSRAGRPSTWGCMADSDLRSWCTIAGPGAPRRSRHSDSGVRTVLRRYHERRHRGGRTASTPLSALPAFSSWRQCGAILPRARVLASAVTFALIDRAKMRLLGRHEPEGVSVYRNDAFDGHGDMVGHLNQRTEGRSGGVKASERISGGLNQRAYQPDCAMR